MTEQDAFRLRRSMITEQLLPRGIRDQRVLAAMRLVPRHLFVPERHVNEAYDDGPVSIGFGQTISQPYVVASMTQELKLPDSARVLEVGTGCGYQTAILAEIGKDIFSIERIPELASRAHDRLRSLGYENCFVRSGDGYAGRPEHAPFDGILVAAAAPSVPELLLQQLKIGARMIIPVTGELADHQQLFAITRTASGFERQVLYDVRFVPLVPGTE